MFEHLRVVVTGTGRSGTGYGAEVLTRAGVKCGHEVVFQVGGVFARANVQAESSCVAAYYLDDLARDEVPVALVYRHPVAQLASSHAKFPENWSTPLNVHAQQHPEIEGLPKHEALCRYYVLHNQLILNSNPEWIFNVKDRSGWERMMLDIGIPPEKVTKALAATATNVNTGRRGEKVVPEPIPQEVFDCYEELERLSLSRLRAE